MVPVISTIVCFALAGVNTAMYFNILNPWSAGTAVFCFGMGITSAIMIRR